MNERGSATILGAAVIGAIALIAGLTLSVTSVAATKTEVEASADMAALAGAQTLHDPLATADPCDAAISTSRHEVIACSVDGPFIQVTTTGSAPTIIGAWDLEAVSRAGPVIPGN